MAAFNTFSPYKSNIDPDIIKQLSLRRLSYELGKAVAHFVPATRNPAWCTVSSDKGTIDESDDGGAPVYPQTLFGDGGMYDKNFKPPILLKQCVIRSGGDFGLCLEVEAQIQCHTIEQFTRVEDLFLEIGRVVTVKFGYTPTKRGGGYDSFHTIKGCRVARYSFQSTPEGFWIANFTALAPGQQLLDLTVHNRVDDSKTRTFKNEGQDCQVQGIAELMLHHAQGNGKRALDSLVDGERISPPIGGAIVAYKSEFLYSNLISSAMGGTPPPRPEKDSGVIHYYTLDYIVNLINKEILPTMQKFIKDPKDIDAFQKLKIKFDSNLSFCYTPKGIRSAYPTKVLLLGIPTLGGTSGDYNEDAGGKDFEKNALSATGVSVGGNTNCYVGEISSRHKINPAAILIEHKIIMEALNASEMIIPPAENTNVKQSEEGGIKVREFFNYLFKIISDCTGENINLRLAFHPSVHDENAPDSLLHELYIFDENNGYDTNQLKCIVFDPIDGDGVTRSATVQSNVGSAQYQGWAISSTKQSSDPASEVKGATENGTTDNRKAQAELAAQSIASIIYGGTAPLARSFFDEIHMQAIREQLGTMRMGGESSKLIDMKVYPGLELDITLDGIFGFVPGNAIMSKQVADRYRKFKTYFMVEQVDNVFDGATSDWSTTLKGKLTFHNTVSYIYLG